MGVWKSRTLKNSVRTKNEATGRVKSRNDGIERLGFSIDKKALII